LGVVLGYGINDSVSEIRPEQKKELELATMLLVTKSFVEQMGKDKKIIPSNFRTLSAHWKLVERNESSKLAIWPGSMTQRD
jgi:hypothetical protein